MAWENSPESPPASFDAAATASSPSMSTGPLGRLLSEELSAEEPVVGRLERDWERREGRALDSELAVAGALVRLSLVRLRIVRLRVLVRLVSLLAEAHKSVHAAVCEVRGWWEEEKKESWGDASSPLGLGSGEWLGAHDLAARRNLATDTLKLFGSLVFAEEEESEPSYP